jgi:hypothetical protein
MKNINRTGTTLLLIGIFILFRKETYFCGFGGCFDDSFAILFSSLIVMIAGVLCLYTKTLKKF